MRLHDVSPMSRQGVFGFTKFTMFRETQIAQQHSGSLTFPRRGSKKLGEKKTAKTLEGGVASRNIIITLTLKWETREAVLLAARTRGHMCEQGDTESGGNDRP